MRQGDMLISEIYWNLFAETNDTPDYVVIYC